MSTPSSDNLYLGAGEVFINLYVNNVLSSTWRHLGNVDKVEITPTVTTLEKKSAMNGAHGTYKEVITGTAVELAMTLSEWAAENLALALLGSSSAYSQTLGTGTDVSLGATNSKKGYYLDTGHKKIVVTSVKVGAVVYALHTDYEVDSETGMILIVPASTIPDLSTVLWSGTWPTIASTRIQALSNAKIEASLRFRSATDATGPRYFVEIWKTTLYPDGALGLLSDSWGDIGLKGKILQDTTKPHGEQYYSLLELPALV